MEKSKKVSLVSGNVKDVIMKLTFPMIFGMLGMIVFNLVDTFYVSKLGAEQLAALTFTFPVILVLNSLIMGIGVGTSSVASRVIGEGNYHKVQRVATDSLLLGIIMAGLMVIGGLLTIEPVFKLLGAEGIVFDYVKRYMNIWYLVNVFVVIPMVVNNIIRALGDTKTPSLVMILSAGINVVLDPLLIFGFGAIPAMGIEGAAIATVISRAVTFVFAIYVLAKRKKVLVFEKVSIKEIAESWKQILYIGLPNGLTKMVVPVATGVVTGLIASYGIKAVASYGIATKLEFFTLAIINALASVIGPFVGQNIGAKKPERVAEGIKFSEKFSIGYSALLFIICAVLAEPIAKIFSSDPQVVQYVVTYLRIVPLAYGLQGVFLIASTALNSMNKPMQASSLTIIQMFVLYLPLAFLGSRFFGIVGIFGGLVISYGITGVLAHLMVSKSIKVEETALEIVEESFLETMTSV